MVAEIMQHFRQEVDNHSNHPMVTFSTISCHRKKIQLYAERGRNMHNGKGNKEKTLKETKKLYNINYSISKILSMFYV